MIASPGAASSSDVPTREDIDSGSLGFQQLAAIGMDAMRSIPAPMLPISVLGLPDSWLRRNRYSEYRIIDVWRLGRTIRYLTNLTFPSVPHTPPPLSPPFLDRFFWQPTVILQRPDHNGSYTSFPDEAWFFVNGVATNDSVAQINSAYLSYLFHRPLTMIQNSTDSLLLDLFECMLGKQWYRYTEAATKAFSPIYDALRRRDKHRVVVIAHSQGTIIMAVILRMLAAVTTSAPPPEAEEGVRALFDAGPPAYAPPVFVYPDQEPWRAEDFPLLSQEELTKLEVYCFANCANTMKYIHTGRKQSAPFIESFGNENDLVARLGMLAPRRAERRIEIDGPCYVKPNGWGHLLNAHYLLDIEKEQKRGRKPGGAGTSAPYVPLQTSVEPRDLVPRLFSYINGGEPEAED